jgi:NADP-dependent 3-hydroxy acid dehydrogenase YdfG
LAQKSVLDSFRLDGKVALVTGGARGLGLTMATALAQAGADVALCGRSLDSCQEAARATAAATGRLIRAYEADVTKAADVDRLAADVEAEMGKIDILVNNAGVNIRERRWAELNPARIDTVVDGNLSSAFYVSAAVLPLMRAQKDGVLIHTASWAGRYISPMSGPAYTAAKHAVVAMSHTINIEEFDNGIRSSVICPGEVATPILDNRPVPVSAEDRARMLQAEDLGDVILFVATRPKRVCINEVLIGPAWNRSYLRMRG